MASKAEYYQPGDLVYQGKPFVRVLSKDLWDKVCAGCFKRNRHLLFCKGCQVAKYCGRKCQKRAWSDHKVECQLLKNYTDHRNQLMVQVLGNLIMKLKGRDWKTVTEKVLDEEVSFDDLFAAPDANDLWRDDQLDVRFESIKIPLSAYISEENMPNDEELVILFKKVKNNCFFGSDFASLFIGLSKFAVSCVPNCSRANSYEGLSIRAIKPIRKGSEQLSISILNLLISTSEVNVSNVHDCSKRLQQCRDCSQPYGQSPLTKILEACNGSKVIRETELMLRCAASLTKLGYPIDIISRAHVKMLLEKQKGVLGDTNLLRIRTLALKCRVGGPAAEMQEELKELISWMKDTWGENCPELISMRELLIEVSLQLFDFRTAENEKKEVARLKRICYGPDADFSRGDVRYSRDFDREEFERGLHLAFRLLSGMHFP